MTTPSGDDLLSLEKRKRLAQWIARQRRGRSPSIPRRQVAGPAPLSFGQERLWFFDQLAPGNPFYNDCTAIRLRGRLELASLSRALNALVARHEILRTSFPSVNGHPVQRVHPERRRDLPLEEVAEHDVQRRASEEAQTAFDIAAASPIRARLLRLAADDHVLLVTMHHILYDGWSLGVIFRELSECYRAFVAGEAPALEELPIQYADFAVWQRGRLTELVERQLAYWNAQLAGRLPELVVPTDRPRPEVQSFRGAAHFLKLPGALSEAAKELSRRERVTPFVTLLTVFETLLWHLSGQDEILVGTAVAGRNHREIEPLVGFFVNTLVLRTRLDGDPSFRELLACVSEAAVEAWEHQDLPFERLVEELKPERKLSRNPLFQVWFNLVNTPLPSLELPGLEASLLEVDHRTARLELALILWEGPDGFRGGFEYATDLFLPSTIEQMGEQYREVLRLAVSRPELRIGAIAEHLSRTDERRRRRERDRRRESELSRLRARRGRRTGS